MMLCAFMIECGLYLYYFLRAYFSEFSVTAKIIIVFLMMYCQYGFTSIYVRLQLMTVKIIISVITLIIVFISSLNDISFITYVAIVFSLYIKSRLLVVESIRSVFNISLKVQNTLDNAQIISRFRSTLILDIFVVFGLSLMVKMFLSKRVLFYNIQTNVIVINAQKVM